MSNAGIIENADDPIASLDEDALNRGPFAERLAGVLKAAPLHSSSVFALYGEWGSGKTSVKNLVRQRFDASQGDQNVPLWIEFNPWAFSTQTELFQSFFSEISRGLGRKKAGDAAVAISKLGSYLSIGGKTVETLAQVADLALIPGGSIGRLVADTLGKGGKRAAEYAKLLREGGVESLEDVQQELRRAIEKLGRSILIVIDDIDRLPPAQVIQMFQVIRANASLPRINYLLLLDRQSIVHALKSAGHTADYLEKIVQFAIDLPRFGPAELREFTESGLKAIAQEAKATIDWNRWRDDYREGCQFLVDTPRKVRRLLHTFRFHLSMFCQDGVPEVDVTDLFILEVIRLYAPDVWLRLPSIGQALFEPGVLNWYIEEPAKGQRPGAKEMATALEHVSPDARKPCERIIKLLLPQLDAPQVDDIAALSTCRMCTALHFHSYFMLRTNATYPTQREAFELVSRASSHEDFLASLRNLADRYGFGAIIGKLQAFQKNCTEPAVIEVMLGAVWRLQQETAARPAIDDVGAILDTDLFSRFFLAKIRMEAERVHVANRALQTSGAPRPLVSITTAGRGGREKNVSGNEVLFSAASARLLRASCFKIISDLRAKDQLVWHPHLGRMFWLWEEREGVKTVRDWIREQEGDPLRLATVLTQFFSRSVGRDVRYYIEREHVTPWLDLDEVMKRRLRTADLNQLDQWQVLAVKEVLSIIEQLENAEQDESV
jgi:hypothetical protein